MFTDDIPSLGEVGHIGYFEGRQKGSYVKKEIFKQCMQNSRDPQWKSSFIETK